MGTLKPPVVVAVVEDDAPSRTAPGCLLQAAGVEPLLFEAAEACIEASVAPTCIIVDVYRPGTFFCKPVDGHILTATIASLANR